MKKKISKTRFIVNNFLWRVAQHSLPFILGLLFLLGLAIMAWQQNNAAGLAELGKFVREHGELMFKVWFGFAVVPIHFLYDVTVDRYGRSYD